MWLCSRAVLTPPALRNRSPSQSDSGIPPAGPEAHSRSVSVGLVPRGGRLTALSPRSSVALCKLLQHGITADDRRLQDIRVKGEELHSPDEGVRTRSKSVQFLLLFQLD